MSQTACCSSPFLRRTGQARHKIPKLRSSGMRALVSKTRTRISIVVVLVLTTAGFVGTGRAQKQSFTTIDPPGAVFTEADGISSNGEIVGNYSTAAGAHGFLLSNGVFKNIDVP